MLFSIIIPMYNERNTLDKCLSSILKQSEEDYQVLIVDDGSTDASLEIAKGYEARDPRFSVISTPHRETGAARNKGLEYARGEYVIYMDADDYWLREDLLQILKNRIEQHPTDVLMYQMVKVTDEGDVLKRYTKPRFQRADEVLELKDIYLDLVRDGQVLASACNKCVRRELLEKKGVVFREDVLCEDIDWVLRLFSKVETIRLLNLDAYAYTQHKGESRSNQEKAPDDLVEIVTDWSRQLRQGTVPHEQAVAGFTAFEYGICMGNYHRLSEEKKRMLREHLYLLNCGLDRKTKLIGRFHRVFGFHLTCLAIRVYLRLRRIW